MSENKLNPKYKLSSDEEKFFDALKKEYTLPDEKTWVNKNAEMEWNMMQNLLMNIGNTKGRKYALAKMLSTSKNFNDEKEFPDAMQDAWNPANMDDFVPPDVEKKQANEDAKNFWNWESDRHWHKLDSKDIERRAKNAGYADPKAYLEDVAKVQTEKDRNDSFNEEFGLLSPVVRLAYPRATEALMRGDDIKGTDIGLDIGEQALYALDPVGRAAKSSSILAGKGLLKAGAKDLIGAMANPAIMELADDIAYEDPNNPRSEFSKADVAMGTGINLAMNKLLPMFTKDRIKTEREMVNKTKPNAEQIQLNEKRAKLWDEKNKELRELLSKQRVDEARGINNPKLNETILDKFDELNKVGEQVEVEMIKKPMKELVKENASNLVVPDAVSFGSNKAGDAISENPRMTKQLLRKLGGSASRFVGPFLNDVIDAYYKTKEGQSEMDKIDYLLGDWRER